MALKKLERLVEAHTRAEVLARLGDIQATHCYAHVMIELMNEIRVLQFGTADLVKLGDKFGLLGKKKRKLKKKKRKIKRRFGDA